MGKRDKDEDERSELTTITPVGIACFVHVWEKYAFKKRGKKKKDDDDDEGQYMLTLVFDEDEDLDDLQEIIDNAAIAKFGKDEYKRLVKKGKFGNPIRDAEDYEEHGWPFDDGDRKMINVKTNTAPGVVDERAKPIIKQADFYAGCKARVSVYAHAYDSDEGAKGVTLLLNNVQKAGDGEPLGGQKRKAEDEFGKLKGAKGKKGGRSSRDDDDDDIEF